MLKRILVPWMARTTSRACAARSRTDRANFGGHLVLYRAVPIPATYGAMYAGVPLSQRMIDEDTAAAMAISTRSSDLHCCATCLSSARQRLAGCQSDLGAGRATEG